LLVQHAELAGVEPVEGTNGSYGIVGNQVGHGTPGSIFAIINQLIDFGKYIGDVPELLIVIARSEAKRQSRRPKAKAGWLRRKGSSQ
jgi:hypothetical protein